MLKSPIPCENPAMTKTEAKPVARSSTSLFSRSPDGLRELVRAVMQEVLEAEMTEALGRREGRALSRPARLPLRLLLAHSHHSCGQARTARTARPGRALLDFDSSSVISARTGARGDFGRDVRAGRLDPEGQGDHRGTLRPFSFSASAISAINKRLDESLEAFAGRPPRNPLPTSSSTRATRRCARAAW